MALDSLLCSRPQMQIDQLDLLIHRAASLCASHGLYELSFLENLDLYQYVSSGGTWEDLSAELHAAQHGDDAADENSRLMRRIMNYIDLHYTEDIRISDVAARFYLNASYMSTLIRKKTGKPIPILLRKSGSTVPKGCCSAPMKRCLRWLIW